MKTVLTTIVVSTLCLPSLGWAAGTLEAGYLRCEYRVDPMGVDVKRPRLSWIVQSDRRGDRQTAYRVLVASRPELLAKDESDLWDSGKVDSDQTIHVVYDGKPLESRKRCYWKVRVWNRDGKPSPWSDPAMWTTGLFEDDDWAAPWIAGTYKPAPGKEDHLRPATLLRTQFNIPENIERATIYLTGLGLYEARINGKRVGDDLLAPEWTVYAERIQYRAFDVTDLVQTGDNAVGAILSDGWYSGRILGLPGVSRRPFKGQRGFRMRLDVELAGGKTITIGTDPTWKETDEGPWRHCSLYDGDTYDARLEMPGWDRPGFDDSTWGPTREVAYPGTRLVWQPNEPIRATRELKPVELSEPEDGVYRFDLGQNMVGWCRLTIRGCDPGTEVTMYFVEWYNVDGKPVHAYGAKRTDTYICRSADEVVFEPKFTYHGFQYVEVRGLEEKPKLDNLTGVVIHSDAPRAGRFECSNPLINQLMASIYWTQIGNMHSVPTDCPQRGERLGWMGDPQTFSQAAIFNMDMAAFFSKWTQDIMDSQHPEGPFPDISHRVHPKHPRYASPAWADAGVFIPWRIYQNYAGIHLVEKHIDSMRAWIDFLHRNNPDLIWNKPRGRDYSDWVNLSNSRNPDFPRGPAIPKVVFATAFWHQSTTFVSKMYAALGRFEESDKYAELADGIRQAFNERFVSEDGRVGLLQDDGSVKDESQAGYALALRFGLLEGAQRERAVAHLVDNIEDTYGGRLSTGMQTTHRMMIELSRNGHHDLACRLITRRAFPSWGYMLDQGSTTIWECWDTFLEETGVNPRGTIFSFNHFALGSVAEWVYRFLAGFNDDPEHPGWKHFTIAPMPHKTVTWVKADYNSIRGPTRSDWRVENGKITLKVTIPPNTTATVRVPTTDAKSVTESGQPADRAEGITFLRAEKDAIFYGVESGEYTFAATYTPHESHTPHKEDE